MTRKIYAILSILLIASFALAACGSPATPAATEASSSATEAPVATEAPASGEPVTVTWWHIATAENHKALLQTKADEYMALHPNVTIEITVLENEAFKTKLTTVMQSGEPPDIFQSWGGGVMNEYANAGLLQDITPALDADGGAWRDTFSPGALGVYALQGKNYGVPWDMGMVGFWYNKDLFTQAGIEGTPATWTELLEDVTKLKAAGITPIAVGEGDKWPGHFYWAYLATRICGQAGFEAAALRTGAFTDSCFVEAGAKLNELIALEPFQEGFLAATYGDEATAVGNGKAAMELMGQWAPGVQKDNSEDKQGLGDKLAWFPFPSVDGGAGDPGDAFGGGNGYAIGKNASPEAVDFVKFLSTGEAQAELAKLGLSLPVVKGGEAGLSDPFLITIQKASGAAKYFQLYYDQALPPAVGSVINDSVQGIFAGSLTPEQAAQAVEDSAAQEIK
jgi:raffinose/stachyose/melibiose transport system substrate-binding protein